MRNKLFAFSLVVRMNTQIKLYSFARSIIGIIMEMKNPSQFSEMENLLNPREKRLFASPLTHSIFCFSYEYNVNMFMLAILLSAHIRSSSFPSQSLIINYSEMSRQVAVFRVLVV